MCEDRMKAIIRQVRIERILEEGLAQLIIDHSILHVIEAAVKYAEDRAEQIEKEEDWSGDPRIEAWKNTASAIKLGLEKIPK